ncbi:MAG: NADH-quinone oxidoreductase subunit NuoB [Candidatus Obscuribacterales bacterium]|nr:NADH-quinone oxidoreductase subunit NuoB [Candidatus Obscuribacterales bacterium]
MESTARGLPKLTDSPCRGTSCNRCAEICPTNAINVFGSGDTTKVALDLGSCIGCSLCIDNCPTETIRENRSTELAVRRREHLLLINDHAVEKEFSKEEESPKTNPFGMSLSARVVSTGCSACDLEIGAAGNPIFDMERFGVRVVASPRHADALLVTGPVGKGMQMPLKRCYEAMTEPKSVVAVGTCAISGGVHKGSYTEANGVDSVLPVDVYIPGCPPHPWSIIDGVLKAMGKKR